MWVRIPPRARKPPGQEGQECWDLWPRPRLPGFLHRTERRGTGARERTGRTARTNGPGHRPASPPISEAHATDRVSHAVTCSDAGVMERARLRRSVRSLTASGTNSWALVMAQLASLSGCTCSRRGAADDERGHVEGNPAVCDEVGELLLCGVEQRREPVVVDAVRERQPRISVWIPPGDGLGAPSAGRVRRPRRRARPGLRRTCPGRRHVQPRQPRVRRPAPARRPAPHRSQRAAGGERRAHRPRRDRWPAPAPRLGNVSIRRRVHDRSLRRSYGAGRAVCRSPPTRALRIGAELDARSTPASHRCATARGRACPRAARRDRQPTCRSDKGMQRPTGRLRRPVWYFRRPPVPVISPAHAALAPTDTSTDAQTASAASAFPADLRSVAGPHVVPNVDADARLRVRTRSRRSDRVSSDTRIPSST
jgi:hypothetical protein